MNHALLPYDRPGYAEGYDAKYLASGVNAAHARFETELVAELARGKPGCSWLDVCCGTGFHLRETPGEMRRVGVDRSPAMLDVARSRAGRPATFHCRDARWLADLGRFDLVTSFFHGYAHAPDVELALGLLCAMADAAAPGGDLLLGICDPAGAFERQARSARIAHGQDIRFDAIVWSYDEPGGGARFRHCVAPHPALIAERLTPLFAASAWREYPASDAAPGWRRRALHLVGRLEDAP